MDVKGGTYTVKPNKALVLAGNRDVEITGGTYNVDPSAYVAEDYTVNGPVDGWYTVYPAGNDTMSITVADNIDLNINSLGLDALYIENHAGGPRLDGQLARIARLFTGHGNCNRHRIGHGQLSEIRFGQEVRCLQAGDDASLA